MKDSEFIELLNLYLDHEIDPADAERLESEVQRDAKRRQIYRQYCQMQKACSHLADKFADTSVDERSVEVFTPTRISRPTWYAGGLAIAACLTVVLLVRSHRAVAPVNNAAPIEVAQAPARAPLTPVLDLTPKANAVAFNPNASFASTTPSQLQWMKQVQFSPIDLNAGVTHFDTKSVMVPGRGVLVAPQISSEPMESVAFTLQR